MPLTHWNEPLARLLESRLVYAIDSEGRNQTCIHRQPGLELNLTCQGRGTLHVGTQTFPVTAGTLVIIPHALNHKLEVHTPGRYARSVLCIAPKSRDTRPFTQVLRSMIQKPTFRKPHCLYLSEDSALRVRSQISRIATEARQQNDCWQEIVFAQASELLALSARLALHPRPVQPPGGRLADEAATYVATHLDGDLTVETVSGQLGVSREHLSRSFHQQFGMTYKFYVLNKRIDATRHLLADMSTTSSLLDIALAAGFQSHAHFSRVFRKHEGITPTQFRTLRRMGS